MAEPDLHKLFIDLVRLQIRLHNAVHQRLRADVGLGVNDYEILRLVAATADCRVADIARELVITVGAASKAVDRLEAAGHLERRANPRNRRSSLVVLTDAGRAPLESADQAVATELGRLLRGRPDDDELADLAMATARLLADLETEGVGRPSG